MEQTRPARDEAYGSRRRIRGAAQREIDGPRGHAAPPVVFHILDDADKVMSGELYQAAVRRG